MGPTPVRSDGMAGETIRHGRLPSIQHHGRRPRRRLLYPAPVNQSRDLELLVAVVIAIIGVAGFLIARTWLLRIVVLAGALLIAAWVAEVLPPLPF